MVTDDGSWAAHFEHTFTLTPDGAWVLTALDGGEAQLAELGVPFGGAVGARTRARHRPPVVAGHRPASTVGRAPAGRRASSIGRRPHEPSMRECALVPRVLRRGWRCRSASASGSASGPQYGGEFFAGWLTEYSLSVDNLFIFIIIMAKFAVPRQYQQTALMVGIVLALVLRGIFIAVGAAAINAVQLGLLPLRRSSSSGRRSSLAREGRRGRRAVRGEPRWSRFVADATSRRPTSGTASSLLASENGKRMITPMFIVILALGTTDLLFALDSIPAIYGLTQEPYLVFTANVFALMGLRQLYFLIGGLLERLVYLSYGLAFLLVFIGVKLILHALHENELPFINGGHPVEWAPEIPIWLSLLVIVGTLVVTAVASLLKARPRRSQELIARALR